MFCLVACIIQNDCAPLRRGFLLPEIGGERLCVYPYLWDMATIRISDFSSLNFAHDWKPGVQRDESYFQKFLSSDTIRVQYSIDDTSVSVTGALVASDGTEVTYSPAQVYVGEDYTTYEFELSNLNLGKYVFELRNGSTTIDYSSGFEVLTETIEPTMLLTYAHRRSEFGTAFDSLFAFRVEAVFLGAGWLPQVEAETFRDQNNTLHLLSAFPYKTKTLTIGGGAGVPAWVAFKINQIFSCSSVTIDGEEYVRGDGAIPEPNASDVYSPLNVYTMIIEPVNHYSKEITI